MSIAINHLPSRKLVVAEPAVTEIESRPKAPDQNRKVVVTALLLSLLAFSVFNANMRLISAGDNYPARYLPFIILKHRSLTLDPLGEMVAQGHPNPFWCVERDGHLYSRYPITVAVFVTPLYVPAVAYLNRYGWSEDRLEQTARVMEKLTASLIASLSVGLMYLLLVRRTNCTRPLLLTVAYAFGTNTWMTSSQALWQHGLAELLLVLALYIALGRCTGPRAVALGLCLALVIAARPPDVLLATALGLYGLPWARGKVGWILIGGVIPLAILLAYNYQVAQHPAGGYSLPRNGKYGLDAFRCNVPLGVLGLLFSPARGLFVFSPFLLFLPIGVRDLLRDSRHRNLILFVLLAIVAQIALYARLDWRAGNAWGPRWLTDMQPLLVWMIAAGQSRLRAGGLAAFTATVCFSIGVQMVGAFWFTGESNAVIMKQPGDPGFISAVWDPRNAPFVTELRHEPAPRELLLKANGSIDLVRANGTDVEQIFPGNDLAIEGWALTDQRSPTAIVVSVVPAVETRWRQSVRYPLTGTTVFFERVDVTQSMRGRGPAGWRVVLKTDGLEPGPHWIELRAQGNMGGEARPVARRRIEILRADLESLSRVAGQQLRDRQHADGYWLTFHTKSTQFTKSQPEMNVFGTAMIRDVLEPVAKVAGFEENLERVRTHLRDQIESSGLVRFHGRIDSPTIPALGCIITPDTDDTALAWRIADLQGDARQVNALEVLKSYRTPEGLYRTWLAPKAEYISIDPGDDPNPPDIGIQMHLLMWLAQVDPAEAKSLHSALQSAIGEDRAWVYYKRAPLVPLWREADLHNLGYPVHVPPERVQTVAPEQEIWVKACRRLAQYSTKGAARPDAAETREMLEFLGKNNFTAIRTNPPLLYHNDLTARCSRYYWSEDFGYALWLRLYQELAAQSLPSDR